MAVKIRLKRLGKVRTPHYRIVVIDSRRKRDGHAIEELGQYHPKNDPSIIKVDSERARYWLSVGAQPTEAVVALLKRTGDWQQFTGDASPSGIDPQPEKKDKLAAFNAALAEKGDEPVSDAITAEDKSDTDKSDTDKSGTGESDVGKSDVGKADASAAESSQSPAAADGTDAAGETPAAGSES